VSGESTSKRREKKRGRMGLDLLLFQADKDGSPELIKQSQRARFKSEAIVDEIQEEYKQWTRGILLRSRTKILTITVKYDLDQTNKEINSTQKEIGKILKVRII
jgi:seryl-tRNA synthetase